VKIGLESLDAARAEGVSRELAEAIRTANGRLAGERRIQILGPAPAPLERLRGRFRWQLLLKGREPSVLRSLARPAVEAARHRWRSSVRIAIDVDPYGML
jgi:primosomal protein N' (replication factor Y)